MTVYNQSTKFTEKLSIIQLKQLQPEYVSLSVSLFNNREKILYQESISCFMLIYPPYIHNIHPL